MSVYKPPQRFNSLIFNVNDFNYQTQGLTFSYAEERYANVNDDSDLYLSMKADSIANNTKLTDVSYASSITTIANTLQPTGLFQPASTCKIDLTSADSHGSSTQSFYAGYQAGNIASATSTGNCCVGVQSGFSNSTGTGLTTFGFQSGYSFTGDAEGLCAFGHQCAKFTTAPGCCAMGNNALTNNTLGSGNTCFGRSALRALTGSDATTQYNTAMGDQVCRFMSGGVRNCAFGASALYGTNGTQLDDNCAFGNNSLTNATTISSTHCKQNTAFGSASGSDITTGQNNLLLGYQAGTSSSPSGSLTTQNNRICLGNSSITNIYCQVALTVVSDARDKTDIQDLTINGLDYINALQPKIFRMNDRNKYFEEQITGQDEEGNDIIEIVPIPNDGSKKDANFSVGFIAQDIQAVEQSLNVPNDLVFTQISDSKLGLIKENLIPFLVDAIKRQQVIIEDLQARIQALTPP